MYYILKLSESWTLFDSNKQTSRAIDKTEIESLKNLFPGLINENQILSTLSISNIPPNKLTKLTANEKSKVAKKSTDPPLKLN